MTRKQARKQSVGMCQTMTLSVIAFLFVFAGIFSAQLVRAEEGDAGADTSSESSESPESTSETLETSEETVTEDALETTEEEVSEEVASFEVESDDSEVVIEEVTVDVTSTDEESTSDTVVEEVFEMFSSFAPMFVMEEEYYETLTINKNVIDKDGNDISDNTEFTVTIALYDSEVVMDVMEEIISEDAPASIELMSGTYEVCEVLEEGSDYEMVTEPVFEKELEVSDNCKFVFIGEGDREITFTNRKLNEEKSGRRPGRRHTVGGQVLGAFTGDSSTGGSCGMYLNSYMRIGANNNVDDVMKLQAFLNEQGYPMPVNGVFSATTEAAVKAFQKTHAAEILVPWGITDPTGYVYKMTRYVMNNMVCAGSEAKPTI